MSLRTYSSNHIDLEVAVWGMQDIGGLLVFMDILRKRTYTSHGLFSNNSRQMQTCCGVVWGILMQF